MTTAQFWAITGSEIQSRDAKLPRDKGGGKNGGGGGGGGAGWTGRGKGGGWGKGGKGGAAAPAYLYYKLNITDVDGSTLAAGANMDLLLDSTSVVQFSANSGNTSASSAAGGYNSLEPFQCQGADLVSGWLTSSGVTGWLKWTDDGTIDVRSFAVTAIPGGLTAAPKDFTFEYSDNDSDWTVALTVTGETNWLKGETRIFDTGNNGSHKYWKIDVTDADGSTQVGLLSLRPILADESVVTKVPRKALATALASFDNTNNAGRLLDTVLAQGWTGAAGTLPNHVIVSFAVAKAANELKWQTRTGEQDRSPKDFTIEGSNDFVVWDVLKTVTGETGWASEEERSFSW